MEATIDIRTADGNVNILLDDAQVTSLRKVLEELCGSTKAVFSMLIDAAGRVVATGGATSDFELEAIAALAAADLATSRQLAAILGEPELALLLQQEKQKNLFMRAIESDAVLIVVFDVGTSFGALRLRIRRSISNLQEILRGAKRSTVVALSSTAAVTSPEAGEEEAREGLAPAARTKPVAPAQPVQPEAALPAQGLPDPLVAEVKKVLTWFSTFKGWQIIFQKELTFLQQALERHDASEADTIRGTVLRLRARLKEQKRLLEARFRVIQSLYQQFLIALQGILQGAWRDEVVDRAMRVAFSGVGKKYNLIGSGISKREGNWTLDFAGIGKQLVSVCHEQNWDYQQGMKEMLVQLNSGMSALSSFISEDSRLRMDLTKSWARLYQHYTEGLKTLELESDVLDLFRPIIHFGQVEAGN